MKTRFYALAFVVGILLVGLPRNAAAAPHDEVLEAMRETGFSSGDLYRVALKITSPFAAEAACLIIRTPDFRSYDLVNAVSKIETYNGLAAVQAVMENADFRSYDLVAVAAEVSDYHALQAVKFILSRKDFRSYDLVRAVSRIYTAEALEAIKLIVNNPEFRSYDLVAAVSKVRNKFALTAVQRILALRGNQDLCNVYVIILVSQIKKRETLERLETALGLPGCHYDMIHAAVESDLNAPTSFWGCIWELFGGGR